MQNLENQGVQGYYVGSFVSRSNPSQRHDRRGGRGPSKIGDLVAKVLKMGRPGGRLGHRALQERWSKAAGPLGEISRPRRLAAGCLEVDVSSAAGVQELTLQSGMLLERLSALEGPAIARLKFQLRGFE